MTFFQGSGLPLEALSEIWRSATNGEPAMQPMAFKAALELVAARLAPAPAQAIPPASSAKPPRPVPEGSDMSAAEHKKYCAHYSKLPGGKQGQVASEDAVKFLSKAKLDPERIRQLLAGISGGSPLISRDQFSVAMHETYKAIKQKGGKTPAPAQMIVTPAPPPASAATPAPVAGFGDFGGFGSGPSLDPPGAAVPPAAPPPVPPAATDDFGGFGSFPEPPPAPAPPAPAPPDSGFGGFAAFDAPPAFIAPSGAPTDPSPPDPAATTSMDAFMGGGDTASVFAPSTETDPATSSTAPKTDEPVSLDAFGGSDFDFGGGAVAAAPAPASAPVSDFGGFGGSSDAFGADAFGLGDAGAGKVAAP